MGTELLRSVYITLIKSAGLGPGTISDALSFDLYTRSVSSNPVRMRAAPLRIHYAVLADASRR